MVAFRKLFPVLAVLALLLGVSSASAQTGGFQPLQCTANSGVPPVVRSEGYTELVGDIVITCTGGNPASPFFANFQVFLNTNITSRLLSVNSTTVSEALLMIDEPGLPRTDAGGAAATPTPFCVALPGQNSIASTTCNPANTTATFQSGFSTVFYGQQTLSGSSNSPNALVWAGVPVTPPGSNRSRVFRITNIRANANGLGASQTLIPTQIVAFVSVTPPGTLPINNPQQVVGYVQQGLVFDRRNAGNTDSIGTGLDQCASQPDSQFRPGGILSGTGELATRGIFRFREGFQTSFKPRLVTTANGGLQNQNGANVGVVFNAESGFVRTADVATAPGNTGFSGLADTGTRLAVRFQNLPANLRIFVSTTDLGLAPSSTSTAVGAGALPATTPRAQYVATDANGASSFGTPVGSTPPTVSQQGTLTGGPTGGVNPGFVEVPITSGSGLAVWEVIRANDSVNEEFLFSFGVGFQSAAGSSQLGLGTGQVIGSFAPFYAAAAGNVMSSVLPIPRFTSQSDAATIVAVSPCRTNLLFPYVTNWSGFDTGIAIANTSADPFSDPQNRTQSGRCTMNYYGTLQAGNQALTLTNETTNAEVQPGQTITMVLSSGGSLGLRGNPNMQGYIIAVCDFRFAHGFAFITDGPIGQARVAEGYLALVLDGPDTSGRLRGNTSGESRGH